MSLSVCASIGGGGTPPEEWMARVREYADELVIGVDASSGPATVELARTYADQVHLFERPQVPEEAYDWIRRKARCDWIFGLDDDEFMNRGFAARLPALMADRELTHYLFPRRWVVPGAADGGLSWIRSFPWFPDAQLRLFRNIGSLFHHIPKIHTATFLLGEGRIVSVEEAVIYHMDLAWKSRAHREAKAIARYGAVAAQFYLYEDRLSQLDLAPVPEGELDSLIAPPAPRSATAKRSPADLTSTRPVTREQLIEGALQRAGELPLYSVEYSRHDTPARMQAGMETGVEVELRNTSRGIWRASGQVPGRVMLSYHWFPLSGGEELVDGRRSMLPWSLRPGESAVVNAALVAPATPGRYRLTWDLVHEGVAWFADKGANTITVELEVRSAV